MHRITLTEVLQSWTKERSTLPSDYDVCATWEQQYPEQAVAFGYELNFATIAERAKVFQAIAPEILALCLGMGFRDEGQILRMLWQLWLPLATQLRRARQQQHQPLIQGILGGQGTGKTTLCRVLQQILGDWGYSCLALSIDDLYKSYHDRQALQQAQPQLIWRGPPGTHDIATGLQVLTQLQQATLGEKIAVPRFDKSLHQGAGDRIPPELVNPADIILFEGWFVGCRPINPNLFTNAPAPIETASDRQFARKINESLRQYLPLWDKLDRLLVLLPEDYRFSKIWRKEAEHKMMAQGKTGMDDAELDQFVDYFWRSLHPELFITPLTQNRELTNLIIEIDRDHHPTKIYRPKNPA